MEPTVVLFMHKEMLCALCNTETGMFLLAPSMTNPESTVVALKNVAITKEAKSFIKDNHIKAEGDFSFFNLMKEDVPFVSIFNHSRLTVLSLATEKNVTLGAKSDISLLEDIPEIDEYELIPTLSGLLEMYKVNLGL